MKEEIKIVHPQKMIKQVWKILMKQPKTTLVIVQFEDKLRLAYHLRQLNTVIKEEANEGVDLITTSSFRADGYFNMFPDVNLLLGYERIIVVGELALLGTYHVPLYGAKIDLHMITDLEEYERYQGYKIKNDRFPESHTLNLIETFFKIKTAKNEDKPLKRDVDFYKTLYALEESSLDDIIYKHSKFIPCLEIQQVKEKSPLDALNTTNIIGTVDPDYVETPNIEKRVCNLMEGMPKLFNQHPFLTPKSSMLLKQGVPEPKEEPEFKGLTPKEIPELKTSVVLSDTPEPEQTESKEVNPILGEIRESKVAESLIKATDEGEPIRYKAEDFMSEEELEILKNGDPTISDEELFDMGDSEPTEEQQTPKENFIVMAKATSHNTDTGKSFSPSLQKVIEKPKDNNDYVQFIGLVPEAVGILSEKLKSEKASSLQKVEELYDPENGLDYRISNEILKLTKLYNEKNIAFVPKINSNITEVELLRTALKKVSQVSQGFSQVVIPTHLINSTLAVLKKLVPPEENQKPSKD